MCRLLGVVTREHTPLREAVPDELPLFTALSERHKDGWGVAWYSSNSSESAPVLEVRKGIDTARVSNEYGQAVADADGELVIVHLRRASVGLGLSLDNTHPFVEGDVAFAHNGQFDMPEGFRERVLARGGRGVQGTTDSELYFSLVTAHAREVGLALAVQRAAQDVTQWVQELGGRYPEGLNCLVVTPHELVAYAQSDPAQLLEDSTWDTYDLRCLVEEHRVIVSSSGYPQDAFVSIPQGNALTIHRGTLGVDVRSPLEGFELAPAQAHGEAAWAAARPDAPGAQPSLRAA